MESGIFYIVGEDIDGNIIEFDLNTDIDSCVLKCEEVLTSVNGGHLDIFIVEDDHDVFVQDVEV